MLRHELKGRRLEQIGCVGQCGLDPTRVLDGVQLQVELGRIIAPGHPFDLKAGQAVALTFDLRLVVVHHLEQGAMAQAPFRLQGFDQLLEWQVLMGLGPQHTLFDLRQQVIEVGICSELGPEYLCVDEKADQALRLHPVAVGHWHTHTNVRLPGIPVQQHLEARQQQHEQRHALLLRALLERCRQLRRQADADTSTGTARYCWAWSVGVQFKDRLFIAQLFLPVGQLALLLPSFHPTTLPDGVVGVLDGQRRQRNLLALAVALIKTDKFFHHHRHGPTVGNNVVQGYRQHMFALRQAQQFDPQQRPVGQVERLTRLSLDPPANSLLVCLLLVLQRQLKKLLFV
ncbi:hypothetical protein PPUJ20066_27510 [Pseudomonas putida]|nr:hypothetical protein PPUJ20066_27510 [Pseudomonas putida]